MPPFRSSTDRARAACGRRSACLTIVSVGARSLADAPPLDQHRPGAPGPGAVEVLRGGVPVVLPGRTTTIILAGLALSPNRIVPNDTLIDWT